MYQHFGRIYSEIGKENKLAFIYKKIQKKKKWNEMKTKPCIEWWDEDEWHEKWNLAFNNDDEKYVQYLQKRPNLGFKFKRIF